MSFRCDVCNKASEIGVSPHVVVTRIRRRVYHANQSMIPGHEIECEVKACTPCKEDLGEPIVNESDLPPIMSSNSNLPEFEGNTVEDLVAKSWSNVA